MILTNKKIIKHLYEAKIIEKDSKNDDFYYKHRFIDYEDAIEQCNSEFFKLANKSNYEKKVELIPYK